MLRKPAMPALPVSAWTLRYNSSRWASRLVSSWALLKSCVVFRSPTRMSDELSRKDLSKSAWNSVSSSSLGAGGAITGGMTSTALWVWVWGCTAALCTGGAVGGSTLVAGWGEEWNEPSLQLSASNRSASAGPDPAVTERDSERAATGAAAGWAEGFKALCNESMICLGVRVALLKTMVAPATNDSLIMLA